MRTEAQVSDHYTHGGLLDAVRAAIHQIGKTAENVTVEDLAGVDEFHIGGRPASVDFFRCLGLASSDHALDVGCGLGGPARTAAVTAGCQVTGVDLTAEFVDTGGTLCDWLGLADWVRLRCASALDMPFEDAAFTAAYMMHVGMNIADKTALFKEVHRVLRPGAKFGVYDVMRTGSGDLSFPKPWATTATTSFVAAPDDYERALAAAGLRVVAREDRRDFALAFFAEMQKRARQACGPPPLGVHVVMGHGAADKIENMVADIQNGLIAPVKIIAVK